MSGNPWLRLYAEFAHDPKVQMMSEQMQRRLIMLMCMRCSNVTVTLRNEEIAFQLRITDEELLATKELFIQKGFIDEQWNLLNWEKRQFVSDHDKSGAERQKRWRERVRSEREHVGVTLRNVTVTPPDTDTDTDTDTDIKKHVSADADDQDKKTSSGFAEFWSAYPRDEGKAKALKAWKAKRIGTNTELVERIIADVKKRKAMHRPWLDGFVPHATTYINGERWEDQITTATQQRAPPAFASKAASAIMQLEGLKNANRTMVYNGTSGGDAEDVLPRLAITATA